METGGVTGGRGSELFDDVEECCCDDIVLDGVTDDSTEETTLDPIEDDDVVTLVPVVTGLAAMVVSVILEVTVSIVGVAVATAAMAEDDGIEF